MSARTAHFATRRYEEAMSHPGPLTAPTNYYRALFRGSPPRTRKPLRVVEAPVLVIRGEKDRYLGAEPEAEVSVGGEKRRVVAREVEGAERERLWRSGRRPVGAPRIGASP